MQLTDECFCQRVICCSLFKNHFQADIMSFHFFQIFHFGFAYNLSEQQENLRLPVSKCISFHMVGIEIEL